MPRSRLPRHDPPRFRMVPWLALILVMSVFPGRVAWASPRPASVTVEERFEPADWMSLESAQPLDLGFAVLVPSVVPAPFTGEPAVTAFEGYYSLYWLIPGGAPTFLQVSGEVGGVIPDYSKYGRNAQLEVNADVGGTPAYHDETPIYDLMYWQVGDVVYSVESQGMIDETSLSLANALVTLSAASLGGTEPTAGTQPGQTSDIPAVIAPAVVSSGELVMLQIIGPVDAVIWVDSGYFPLSGDVALYGVGGIAIEWQAPETEGDFIATFYLSDATTGETLAVTEVTVTAAASAPVRPARLICPVDASAGSPVSITLTGSGYLALSASDGYFPANVLNSAFDPDAYGDTTLGGDMDAAGIVSLRWVAPVVNSALDVVLSVYDVSGNVATGCAIAVAPLADSVPPGSRDREGSESVAPIATLDNGNGEAASVPNDGTNVQGPSADVLGSGSTGRLPAGDGTDVGQASKANGRSRSSGAAAAAGTAAAERTPGAAPTIDVEPTLAPATGDDGLVANVIGPEGGELTCPSGATIILPAGALKEPATVTIKPVTDGKVPAQDGVSFIAGTAFDVTLADASGRAISNLETPATLRIELDDKQWRSGVQIYWINGSTLDPMPGETLDDLSVSAPVSHFSRFVAAVPVPTDGSSDSDPVRFILLALAAVLALLLATVLVGFFRRGKSRSVGVIRPGAGSRRRR